MRVPASSDEGTTISVVVINSDLFSCALTVIHFLVYNSLRTYLHHIFVFLSVQEIACCQYNPFLQLIVTLDTSESKKNFFHKISTPSLKKIELK